MLGIILCGGQSRRMGSDKGLMKQGEKTWAEAAADKIAVLNIPVKISVNKDQLAGYAKIFSPSNLVMDNGTLSLQGPLMATLSAHLAFPAEDIFVLACDMPLMEAFMLHTLYTTYQQQPAGAYFFTIDDEAEPLCGIYRAKGLSLILDMFRKGVLTKHSMKYMLDQLDVIRIPVKEEQKKYFSNINTNAGLKLL